jgi:hypothetical protein
MVKAYQALIGQEGRYQIGALVFPVVVLDVRHNFGRVDYHIAPVGGQGAAWVQSSGVVLEQ